MDGSCRNGCGKNNTVDFTIIDIVIYFQDGSIKQKEPTSNKSIQARLEQTVSLKDITPGN